MTKQLQKPRHHKQRAKNLLRGGLVCWLVPQKRNDFKPRAISWRSIGFLVAAFLVVQFLIPASSAVLGQEAPINPIGLLEQTNSERLRAGVEPLAINTQLTKAAALKAKDMLDNSYWSHTSPDGVTPWYWFDKADYSYVYAGENLARNFSSSSGVVAAWMASPGHQENMLRGYYTEVGFAMLDGKIDGQPTTVVVAMYGTPTSSLTEVAGLQTNAPAAKNVGLIAGIGVAVQSMSPGMIGVLTIAAVILLVALVSLLLTTKRLKPGDYHKIHKNHEAVKIVGISLLITAMLMLQSGGQIG